MKRNNERRPCAAPNCPNKTPKGARSDARYCSEACRNQAWVAKHPRVKRARRVA